MSGYKIHSISAKNPAGILVDKKVSKYLFIDAGTGEFLEVEQLANNFKNQANKSSSKGVECNHAEISKRFFFSIKKLTRIVPQYD
jgi:hypothetical protein